MFGRVLTTPLPEGGLQNIERFHNGMKTIGIKKYPEENYLLRSGKKIVAGPHFHSK